MIDYVLNNNPTYTLPKIHTDSCLAVPKAILEFNNTVLYSSYMILEKQLSQMNPAKEPFLYGELEKLTQQVFDSWVALGFR